MSEPEHRTVCFHNMWLKDVDYQALRDGRAAFCPCCHALLWIQDGKIQLREAHEVKQ